MIQRESQTDLARAVEEILRAMAGIPGASRRSLLKSPLETVKKIMQSRVDFRAEWVTKSLRE